MRAGSLGWSVRVCLALLVIGSASAARSQERATSTAPDYIDSMLREAWDSASVKPSKRCDEPEFVRRAYLDILGRIPSADEAVAYLETKDANKRIKLVERLLAHDDYPKYAANLWTVSLLGRGRQDQGVDRAALTSWLRRQFADNAPWDKIAREIITASGSNKDNGAVNFTIAHLENDAVPLTSLTTRLFLGQQIQCTQCHDHPSNDWKQEHFWGINAFFQGMKRQTVKGLNAAGQEVDDHVELTDVPTDRYARYERRNGELRIAYPMFLDGRKLPGEEGANRRQVLGQFITGSENDDFARAFVNRTWAHYMGRGFVHPVDDFGDHNSPSHPELLDQLARDFRASGYDVKALIRWVTSSQSYNLTSQATADNEKDDSLFSHMAVKPMNPEQLFDSLLVATAAHKAGGSSESDRQRDQWLGRFTFAFGNDEDGEGSSFQGTIPQALMMMNGELMQKAVGGKSGSFLAQTLDQAQLQRKFPPQSYALNRLYLAALARTPTKDELSKLGKLSADYPTPILFLQDVFWALLNSNEFILNH